MYYEINKKQKDFIFLHCNRLPIYRIEQEFMSKTGLDTDTQEGSDAFDDWIYESYEYCVFNSDIYSCDDIEKALEDFKDYHPEYYENDIDNE